MVKAARFGSHVHTVFYAPNAKGWLVECSGKPVDRSRVENLPETAVTCQKCRRVWM